MIKIQLYLKVVLILTLLVITTPCYAEEIIYKLHWSNESILPFDDAGTPNLSPDGKQITFTRQGDSFNGIWVVNSDGTNAKMLISEIRTDFNSPIWSPDMAKIYFLKNSGFELWKINSDGSGESPLSEKIYEKMNPTLWPDGTKIIIYKGTPLNADSAIETAGLYIINLSDNTLKPFGEPEWNGPVTFSPDNKTILLLSGQELIFVGLDGTIKDIKTVRTPLTHGEEPIWTPDGRYIILGNLLYVLTTGEEVAFLPDNVVRYKEAGKPDLVGPCYISLSKDGKKIAFLMEEPDSKTYRTRIKVMNLVWK